MKRRKPEDNVHKIYILRTACVPTITNTPISYTIYYERRQVPNLYYILMGRVHNMVIQNSILY